MSVDSASAMTAHLSVTDVMLQGGKDSCLCRQSDSKTTCMMYINCSVEGQRQEAVHVQ